MTGRPLAEPLVELLIARGLTVATAESLTGGLVAAALTDVPGSSAVVLGGIVAYAMPVKAGVLGVDRALLADRGAVDPHVALEMARGARRLFGADVGIATTGVAGPSASEGKPVGTVHIAVVRHGGERHEALRLTGDRTTIRRGTVAAALDLALRVLGEAPDTGNGPTGR